MESGFAIHYFAGDESWGNELPHRLLSDESLDAEIQRITDALRAWIRAKQGGEISHLHISIVGPLDGSLPEDPRTPEEKLADCTSQDDQFYCLGDAAKSRFRAEDFESARAYALELKRITPAYPDDWNYGNAIATANIVLGRLALRDGNVQEAESFLIEAGKSPGSPQMETFGPNMSLAHDLLVAGHPAAVLEYFKLCATFWSGEFSKLDQWTEDVRTGRIPKFGANLKY